MSIVYHLDPKRESSRPRSRVREVVVTEIMSLVPRTRPVIETLEVVQLVRLTVSGEFFRTIINESVEVL